MSKLWYWSTFKFRRVDNTYWSTIDSLCYIEFHIIIGYLQTQYIFFKYEQSLYKFYHEVPWRKIFLFAKFYHLLTIYFGVGDYCLSNSLTSSLFSSQYSSLYWFRSSNTDITATCTPNRYHPKGPQPTGSYKLSNTPAGYRSLSQRFAAITVLKLEAIVEQQFYNLLAILNFTYGRQTSYTIKTLILYILVFWGDF